MNDTTPVQQPKADTVFRLARITTQIPRTTTLDIGALLAQGFVSEGTCDLYWAEVVLKKGKAERVFAFADWEGRALIGGGDKWLEKESCEENGEYEMNEECFRFLSYLGVSYP